MSSWTLKRASTSVRPGFILFAAALFTHLVAFVPLAEISQSTRPKFLPIDGELGQIVLEMANAGRPAVFGLEGKQLKLLSPLDRDLNDISSVVLQVCFFTMFTLSTWQ